MVSLVVEHHHASACGNLLEHSSAEVEGLLEVLGAEAEVLRMVGAGRNRSRLAWPKGL
jgi:hypothetical protein